MEEKVKRLFRRPLYPYLLIVWFLIFQSSECFYSFSLGLFLGFAILLCLVFWGLNWILLRLGIKWAPIVIFSTGAFLLFIDLISDFLHGNSGSIGFHHYYLIIIGLIIIGLSYIWSKLVWRFNSLANLVINVFLIVLCLSSLFNGYKVYNQMSRIHEQRVGIPQVTPAKPIDIVWILMDDYASSPALKKFFKYNNPLDTFLESRGFTILDGIHTRSTITIYSINSIFNLDDSISPPNYMYADYSLLNNLWTKQLKKAGYEVDCLDFLDIDGVKRIANLNLFPQSYTDQIFRESIFGLTKDRYNFKVADSLNTILKESSPGSPRLIWAHLMIPHSPFYRNSKGEFVANNQDYNASVDQIKNGYIEFLSYGNHVLMDIIKNNESLKDKIVVISGDHGTRYSFIEDKDEKQRPFAAIHFPDNFDTTGLKNVKFIQQLPAFIGSAKIK
jgi:hypothetical protein